MGQVSQSHSVENIPSYFSSFSLVNGLLTIEKKIKLECIIFYECIYNSHGGYRTNKNRQVKLLHTNHPKYMYSKASFYEVAMVPGFEPESLGWDASLLTTLP